MQCDFFQTNDSIKVVFGSGYKMRSRVITGESKYFEQAKELLARAQKTGDSNTWNALEQLMDRATAVKRWSKGAFTVEDGELYFRNTVIHDAIADRILQGIDQGLSVDRYLKFLLNLEQNPSMRSREQLYGFLEANSLAITEDGCFLAYKVVGPGYLSIHSGPRGQLFNGIGATVEEPRREVDDDPTRTCSRGLHVCSETYAPHYGGWNSQNHLMVCKVNPCDVVSVPVDYGQAKMRICRYKVVGEVSREEVESRILDRVDYADSLGYLEPDPEAYDEFVNAWIARGFVVKFNERDLCEDCEDEEYYV